MIAIFPFFTDKNLRFGVLTKLSRLSKKIKIKADHYKYMKNKYGIFKLILKFYNVLVNRQILYVAYSFYIVDTYREVNPEN